MTCRQLFLFPVLFLGIVLSTAKVTSPYYDTISNLTHTCQISPEVVCVDLVAFNETSACADPLCLIYSGGNISSCLIALITLNITAGNMTANVTGNMSAINSSIPANVTNFSGNSTIQRCNATIIYPHINKTFCFNATSWNKTVCSQANVSCKINSTHCTLNPVVYVGGFFNLKDKDGFGNIPAAELAISQVNKDNKTLENITLSVVAKQSTQVFLLTICYTHYCVKLFRGKQIPNG